MDNNLIWQGVLDDPDSSYHKEKSNWQDIYDWINLLVHDEVLDVGCGLGHLTHVLSTNDKVKGILGIDISDVAINEARRRHPNHYFFVEDIEVSDVLKDGYYDCVCFTQVLEHIHNDTALIEGIPEGKHVFISVPKETPREHESHVNFFPTIDELRLRYEPFIDIHYIGEVGEYRFLCLYGTRINKEINNEA